MFATTYTTLANIISSGDVSMACSWYASITRGPSAAEARMVRHACSKWGVDAGRFGCALAPLSPELEAFCAEIRASFAPSLGLPFPKPTEVLAAKADPMRPSATYRPVGLDLHRGSENAKNCARDGIGGPCWGQTEWYERRHLLAPGGRCAMPLCKGHIGATYRAEPALEAV